MQNSERFRRGVVVPLDDVAADALATWEVDESTPVHFVEIESQRDFETLWKTGFFASLNEQIGCLLDDYEEERISYEVVLELRRVAESFASRGAGGVVGARFFSALVEACDIAQSKQQPVYFVL